MRGNAIEIIREIVSAAADVMTLVMLILLLKK